MCVHARVHACVCLGVCVVSTVLGGEHHISESVVMVIYISILFIFSYNDHVTFVILKKNDRKRYPFVLAAAKEILRNK